MLHNWKHAMMWGLKRSFNPCFYALCVLLNPVFCAKNDEFWHACSSPAARSSRASSRRISSWCVAPARLYAALLLMNFVWKLMICVLKMMDFVFWNRYVARLSAALFRRICHFTARRWKSSTRNHHSARMSRRIKYVVLILVYHYFGSHCAAISLPLLLVHTYCYSSTAGLLLNIIFGSHCVLLLLYVRDRSLQVYTNSTSVHQQYFKAHISQHVNVTGVFFGCPDSLMRSVCRAFGHQKFWLEAILHGLDIGNAAWPWEECSKWARMVRLICCCDYDGWVHVLGYSAGLFCCLVVLRHDEFLTGLHRV